MSEKLVLNETLKHEELPGYKNLNLTIDERVADLVERMTLEEKVAQMISIWREKQSTFYNDNGDLSLVNISKKFKDGIGQIGRLSDTNGGLNAEKMADLANTIQKYFVEETRLGIPVIFHEECLHGLAAKEATSYPQPIGLASTFNPNLIERIFNAIAKDVRMRGAHFALSPVVDVARDPRWGRVEETFGEDPYLISQMGIAAVKGLQGDCHFNEGKNVIATLKHFAAHGQPESGSNCGPANFSERLLRDVFLFPFKEVIDKANVISVMASYNEIDGIPSHSNKWLLKNILREEWGFNGIVVSDYVAVTELFFNEETLSHSVAKDKKDAARIAAEAGVNIEFPDPDCYPSLVELVHEGILDEAIIDELVGKVLEQKFLLGLFESPYIETESINISKKLSDDRQIALKAARETIVLLKNENNLLPLDQNKIKSIAIIGPNANRKLLGGYSGEPKYFTTLLDGIKNKVGNELNVLYSEGCKITVGGSWNDDEVIPSNQEEDLKLIQEAATIAQKADVVVLALGGNEQTSREAWSKKHMGDRPNLELVGMQNQLVEAILKTGKQVVVLLFNGRPKSINYIDENVPSILECWYLGQESGNAVADVLFGDFNPGGKLPISFPRSAGHIPCFYNHKPSARRGYLFEDITPLYPFGFGLSYTTFQFDNLKLQKNIININETTEVFIDVKNTGQRDGSEVVQMFIRDLVSSVTRPVKELKGFKKVFLKPGEKETVSFSISFEQLAFTNIENNFSVEPGEFEIMVGNSSKDEDLKKIILQVIK